MMGEQGGRFGGQRRCQEWTGDVGTEEMLGEGMRECVGRQERQEEIAGNAWKRTVECAVISVLFGKAEEILMLCYAIRIEDKTMR